MPQFDDHRAARAKLHGVADHAVLAALAKRAMARTRDFLLARQHPAGYWSSAVDGPVTLVADYVLLHTFLGQASADSIRGCGAQLVDRQRVDGGWSLVPGAPLDLDASIRSYLALKLLGFAADDEPLVRARTAILAEGGADRANSLTRYFLALFGQIDYRHCPAIPPEWMFVPRWLPLNPHIVAAQARIVMVPLSIVWARKPIRAVTPQQGISELFLHGRYVGASAGRGPAVGDRPWMRQALAGLDRTLKWAESSRLLPLRRLAIRRALDWMIDRFVGSDGMGADFLGILWSWIALESLGFSVESPEVRFCHEQLAALRGERGATSYLQPARTPVWETAHVLDALAMSGVAMDQRGIQTAVDWLLEKEVTRRGDWSVWVQADPSGWFHEHYNEYYPSVESTAAVLNGLAPQFGRADRTAASLAAPAAPMGWGRGFIGGLRDRLGLTDRLAENPLEVLTYGRLPDLREARRFVSRLDDVANACHRGYAWLLAMQNSDGGWCSKDRSNQWRFLDHWLMADALPLHPRSSVAITGRVLVSLAQFEAAVGMPAVDRAVHFLVGRQERDGHWSDADCGDSIWATSLALRGLLAAGLSAELPEIAAGVRWLLGRQQPSGGWGESAVPIEGAELYASRPTPSHTAWAILALTPAVGSRNVQVMQAVEWLIAQQRPDGTWCEEEFTGTDWLGAARRRYVFYANCYPLLALAKWIDAR